LPRVYVEFAFEEIKFKCQMCGSCCRHRRPADFGNLVPVDRLKDFWDKSNLIYLTNEDIIQISQETGFDSKEFADTLYNYDGRYVKVVNSGKKVVLDLPVMKSKRDKTCIFYRNNCRIYGIRPTACQLFPFRVEEETNHLGDIRLRISFNIHCPGIGKGETVEKKSLVKLVVKQFLDRAERVALEILKLNKSGKIAKDAKVYRSLPGNE
jgi:Fe-S-cluster containining protein